MSWMDKMNEGIRNTIRNWLQITPSGSYAIYIQEIIDFEVNAIRNRIWYRGDSNELVQLYGSVQEYADKCKFWAAKSSPGMDIRKIHTGLPALIIRALSNVVLTDMNDITLGNAGQQEIWERIEKENHFRKDLGLAIKEALVIGDGAWKVSIDTEISEYPILEWYPGDRIEVERRRGRMQAIIFKTPVKYRDQQYVLMERYGYGSITYECYKDGKPVDYHAIPELANLQEYVFDKSIMLATYIRFQESAKWQERGGSIFDGKLDSFDAFDEAWSQWMDALRAGRAKTYIPEVLIPRDPATGQLISPNPFDNRFIASGTNPAEGAENKISTEQPDIPHDSYLASYVTALDLCLQGVISPSTLGIDTKKLDNAEAQREKEKTTLYTRNMIVSMLQEVLPELIGAAVNAYYILHKMPIAEITAEIPFGEYANPSFESQVETVAKAKTGGIMSIEASVDELYGDSKDDEWKAEEVRRLKEEAGISEMEEPALNLEGVEIIDESESGGEDLSDEPEGILRTPAGRE